MRKSIKFDRKATILAPVTVRDSDGGPITSYQPQSAPWCSREDLSSIEKRDANALRSETRCRFTFRWFPSLSPEHRIECDGKVYSIDPPIEIGRRQYLEVTAFLVPEQ